MIGLGISLVSICTFLYFTDAQHIYVIVPVLFQMFYHVLFDMRRKHYWKKASDWNDMVMEARIQKSPSELEGKCH